MSNLTPQLRADINGKLVTRHVKSDTSAPVSRRAFAAPTLNSGLSKKEVEAQRPLKKVKKRKVVASSNNIASFFAPVNFVDPTTVEMSDENIYEYLKSGLTMGEAVALRSVGVESYEWQSAPEQREDENPGTYSIRCAKHKQEVKRVLERRDRFSDVAHRLELRGIPADVASKCLENGLTIKALSGYLNEKDVCEIYSKSGYLKNNMKVMDDLVNGVIPFTHYITFGIRNLNNWEKNCPSYKELPIEILSFAVDRAATPYPGIGAASANEATIIKMAHEDQRVLELRLTELMWHSYRTEKEGGKFSFEEAKFIDDFIYEVRTKGISDLTENRRAASPQFEAYYPQSNGWDSNYEVAKILDWHNAGLSNSQIISGLQNRWSKEQAISVYKDNTAASLAGGIL